jgi:hypothetical protein
MMNHISIQTWNFAKISKDFEIGVRRHQLCIKDFLADDVCEGIRGSCRVRLCIVITQYQLYMPR